MNKFLQRITSLFKKRETQEVQAQVMQNYTDMIKNSDYAAEYYEDNKGHVYLKGIALIQKKNSQRV